MRIDYELREAGWAFLKIEHEGHRIERHVSYLEDCLPQLAKAALAGLDLETGRVDRTVEFADEPGGIRVTVRPDVSTVPRPAPESQPVVLRYEDLDDYDRPKLLFEASTTAAELAHIVLELLEGLYDRFGIVEYQRMWMDGEFPVAEMVRLRHNLGLPPAERRLW